MADNPGPNDDLFAQLADIEIPDEAEFTDLKKLSDLQLSDLYAKTREELLDRKEMLEQRTERGRELISRRNAQVLELRRRGLM